MLRRFLGLVVCSSTSVLVVLLKVFDSHRETIVGSDVACLPVVGCVVRPQIVPKWSAYVAPHPFGHRGACGSDGPSEPAEPGTPHSARNDVDSDVDSLGAHQGGEQGQEKKNGHG